MEEKKKKEEEEEEKKKKEEEDEGNKRKRKIDSSEEESEEAEERGKKKKKKKKKRKKKKRKEGEKEKDEEVVDKKKEDEKVVDQVDMTEESDDGVMDLTRESQKEKEEEEGKMVLTGEKEEEEGRKKKKIKERGAEDEEDEEEKKIEGTKGGRGVISTDEAVSKMMLEPAEEKVEKKKVPLDKEALVRSALDKTCRVQQKTQEGVVTNSVIRVSQTKCRNMTEEEGQRALDMAHVKELMDLIMQNPSTHPMPMQLMVMDDKWTKLEVEQVLQERALSSADEEPLDWGKFAASGGNHHFAALLQAIESDPTLADEPNLKDLNAEVHV